MREHKIKILSTAELDDSLVELAGANGMSLELVPFIETRPVSKEQLQTYVLPLLDQKADVIFTSGNAVAAVASCLSGARPPWTAFCIGHHTRQLVERHFGESAVAGVAGDGESLAGVIINSTKIEPMIFFCGDQRRQELPEMLEMAGTIVKEIIVYRTIASPVKMEEKYDGILFFSPSAVHSFFSMNSVPPETILFSIGSTTAKALHGNTKNKIIVADKPVKEEVLKKAIEYFNK